jgi:leucine-rich repeat protein SHOC2
MEQSELEQIIEQARIDRSSKLTLHTHNLAEVPDTIGNLTDLTELDLSSNNLTDLPESIGNLINLRSLYLYRNQLKSLPSNISNLANLHSLQLGSNHLTDLPEGIICLTNLNSLGLDNNQLNVFPEIINSLQNLTSLYLNDNQLTDLPKSINNLINLRKLDLSFNRLECLPDSIGDLGKLRKLGLRDNRLVRLPDSIYNLTSLFLLSLSNNPSVNLSILQCMPNLEKVELFSIDLPRRYWTDVSDWKSEWLLDEDNVDIRSELVEQIGYERICDELNAITIDTWREYTLIKIHDVLERFYGEDGNFIKSTEPMVLLQMTCPSTQHIHILRVPPEMKSAEAAITWVNHGIHPDEFAVQT